MSEQYYRIASCSYYRSKKSVSLSIDPYEFDEHWWSEKRGIFNGQTFTGKMSDYSNPHDFLPNTNIIQAASGRLIELFRKYTDDVEVFDTVWIGASDEFVKKDYRVLRFPSIDGFIDMSESIVEEFARPTNPPTLIRIIHSPAFIGGAPKILRPLNGVGLYASKEFYEEYKKNRLTGVNFDLVKVHTHDEKFGIRISP